MNRAWLTLDGVELQQGSMESVVQLIGAAQGRDQPAIGRLLGRQPEEVRQLVAAQVAAEGARVQRVGQTATHREVVGLAYSVIAARDQEKRLERAAAGRQEQPQHGRAEVAARVQTHQAQRHVVDDVVDEPRVDQRVHASGQVVAGAQSQFSEDAPALRLRRALIGRRNPAGVLFQAQHLQVVLVREFSI